MALGQKLGSIKMNLVTALAVVIGVMGGIATWAAVTMGSPFVLIWAIFIGWASFFHCGGGNDGLKSSTIANVWGMVCAIVAFIALTSLGVSAVNAALCVGVTVLIMILGAHLPLFGAIPSSVYGYASTAALFLMGGAAYGEGAGGLVQLGLAIAVSMVVGNILGFISEKISGALVAKPAHKFMGGCEHVKTYADASPIDNHDCHCGVCKNVTGQLTTHVVFFNHGDLKVGNINKLNRVPFNADNPDGPLELCVCKDCGTPIMLDDKEKRIRAVVPNLMGMDPAAMPTTYHAFWDETKGYNKPSDGKPVYDSLRPEFNWPKPA